MLPFNNARECLFQTDGAIYTCKRYIDYFTECQENPKNYLKFLERSTDLQKKPIRFDFQHHRPLLDKHI